MSGQAEPYETATSVLQTCSEVTQFHPGRPCEAQLQLQRRKQESSLVWGHHFRSLGDTVVLPTLNPDRLAPSTSGPATFRLTLGLRPRRRGVGWGALCSPWGQGRTRPPGPCGGCQEKFPERPPQDGGPPSGRRTCRRWPEAVATLPSLPLAQLRPAPAPAPRPRWARAPCGPAPW